MSRNGSIGGRAPQRRHPGEHDPYAAPPTQPTTQWPPQQAGYGQPAQAPGYHFPQAPEPDPNYGYAPSQAGYQQQFDRYPPAGPQPGYAPQPQPPQPQWGQPQDPGNYDLGSYMPNGAQGYGQEPPFQHQQDQGHYAPPQQGYGDSDADYDELADHDDEPRRGRRGLMIVGALVGAICLGGALAYTYKTFIASGASRAPLVKVPDSGPNKIKPVVAGGKEFAHTDKKLLNRLDDNAPAAGDNAQDERTSDDPNAPRKVRIIPIQPGGGPAAQPPVTAGGVQRAPQAPMVSVPGLTIDMPPAPNSNAAARPQMPPQGPPVQARPIVQPPQAQPQMKVAAAPPPPAAEPAQQPKKVVVAPPTVAPKNPVPKTKEAPAPTATSGSGFVAVLSSQKSRMDALKAFADLQQKYGDVLATRTPDVQEANLGDKGVWYRAVVGPPASREAASGVCSQLKTAGYNGCWVTAY